MWLACYLWDMYAPADAIVQIQSYIRRRRVQRRAEVQNVITAKLVHPIHDVHASAAEANTENT